MIRLLQILLPVLVLAGGAVAAAALVGAREEPVSRATPRQLPVVEVMRVRAETVALRVESQGELRAAKELDLVAEVAGRVTEMHGLDVGAAFDAGQTLLVLDDADLQLAKRRAEAQRSVAAAALAQLEDEAEAALAEWRELSTDPPPPLVARTAALAGAEAQLASADLAIEAAERDLAKTELSSAFAGRTLARLVEVGAWVTPGQPLARVFSTERVEIRLPVPEDELTRLVGPGETSDALIGRRVTFHRRETAPATEPAESTASSWTGTVARIESRLEPGTRMHVLVARVEAPFRATPERPVPLAIGSFLQASLDGPAVAGAIRIPVHALQPGSRVLVVDERDRLHSRAVRVLQVRGAEAILGEGLSDGDWLCLTPLESVVEGMEVDVRGRTTP